MSTPPAQAASQPDPGMGAVMNERRRLINLAYRLLGSLTDAEDAVQETYIRWYHMTAEQKESIESPIAWLTTVASRICLDQLGSARVRRERYVGEWIPEPVPDPPAWPDEQTNGSTIDPAERVTLDESVSMAFLVVLETMTPAERVAFILHDVYRFAFAEIAEIVGRSPAACRQLASSARRRIQTSQGPKTPTAQQAETVREFSKALAAQDLNALVSLLDPDAVAIADGGGIAPATSHPIEGAERIARLHVELISKASPDLAILERTVNGQPGLVIELDGITSTVLAFDLAGDRIKHIWAVRNPDKLRPWTVR